MLQNVKFSSEKVVFDPVQNRLGLTKGLLLRISQLKKTTITLKSLINEQGCYVGFLVLSEYSFIREFRVMRKCTFFKKILNSKQR